MVDATIGQCMSKNKHLKITRVFLTCTNQRYQSTENINITISTFINNKNTAVQNSNKM